MPEIIINPYDKVCKPAKKVSFEEVYLQSLPEWRRFITRWARPRIPTNHRIDQEKCEDGIPDQILLESEIGLDDRPYGFDSKYNRNHIWVTENLFGNNQPTKA